MSYFKFQIACLAVVIYVAFMYIKDTNRNSKVDCNRYYDLLISISPWAIFFDGFTAWTVNHMDIVPEWINYSAHALFYILMASIMIISYLYFIDLIYNIKNNKRVRILSIIHIAVVIVAILAFLPEVHFIEGKRTNYSMGISVIICYASLVVHYLILLVVLFMNLHKIEKRKVIGIFSALILGFLTLILQSVFPEILISAFFPTFIVVGIYINIENPALIRVQKFNETMVINFATIVENRDDNTGGHIKRTKKYVEFIFSEMLKNPKYKRTFSKDYIKNVINSAPMHDLGKISTPDSILQKPGKLTDEEYAIMKQHAPKGSEIVKQIFHEMEEPEFEKITYEVARYHHEKWNGKGYPEGLSGTAIPLHARIMAIADVFDAVSAKRCYRDALPLEECFEIIKKGSGTDFDPELVEYFLKAKNRVEHYYNSSFSK